MGVNFETFLNWAKNKFGEENIKIKNTPHGTEICTHSFFAHEKGIEDSKFHLCMNPSGGVSKRPERGSYRCWKTNAMGSLVKLVANCDHISYEEAEERICGISTLRQLEERCHNLFETKTEVSVTKKTKKVEFPPNTYEIDSLPESHFMRLRAKNYLENRKIPTNGFHVCVAGEYANRIIIPYYNREGSLIWYNGRLMSDSQGVLRYLKCKSDGVNHDDVLYMSDWPAAGSKVYLMEGEFDAKTLGLCGMTGCAVGGKSLSKAQLEMIKQYQLVLAFDSDDSGYEANNNIGSDLLNYGYEKNITYVRPPKEYKDWNKLYKEKNADVVKWFINKYTKNFTPDTPNELRFNRL